MIDILIYLAIGLAVGGVSGALGIGGGVLLVPALIWLCNFKMPKAAGTSLAVLGIPILLPAAWQAWKNNRVDLTAALWVACGYPVGAFVSAWLITDNDRLGDILRFIFGLLMIYIAMRFVLSSSPEAALAAAGLIGVLMATVAFVILRMLGRRHLPKPDFGQQVRIAYERTRGEPDYHI